MQLTDKSNIRSIGVALSAATCGLLLGTSSSADAATDKPWRIDTGVMYYSEKDRIDVQSLVFDVRRLIGEDEFVTFKSAYDVVSGASPTGATLAQANTSASGSAPFASFSEVRAALGASWDRPITDLTRVNLALNHSRSETYQSDAGSVVLSTDFNQRNTTLTYGVGYARDLNKPAAGIPQALDDVGSAAIISNEGVKNQLDIQLGVTQVLGRSTLVYVNYVWSNADGYLTNPYKVVSVVNSLSGETLSYQPIHEKRPDNRQSNALVGQINHHFGTGVGYATYRFFWDEWDIQAHNLELKYRHPLNERTYVQALVRGYMQSAAEFYRPVVLNGQVPGHLSADYRLAELQTYSAGVKLGYRAGGWGEITLRYELVRQTGEDSPSGTVGVQRNADFFPDLTAHVVHVGYTIDF